MSEKVRENRLRQVAQRRGLRLHKSRRRDPVALDFGVYWLHGAGGRRVSPPEGLDLDGVEQWLRTHGLSAGDSVRHRRTGDVGTYGGPTELGGLARVHFPRLGDVRQVTVKVRYDQLEKVEG